jgi:hypothetical protein
MEQAHVSAKTLFETAGLTSISHVESGKSEGFSIRDRRKDI